MHPFSPDELARMRAVQESAMQDTCVLERCVVMVDDYGSEVETYPQGEPVACGFDPTSVGKREYRRADGTIAVIDGTLRLSIEDGAALTAQDRVRITHRHGELLSAPLVFGLDGPPERGATGIVLRLVQVE